jgi:hypothetical protein
MDSASTKAKFMKQINSSSNSNWPAAKWTGVGNGGKITGYLVSTFIIYTRHCLS